jgi:hypothetical protein
MRRNAKLMSLTIGLAIFAACTPAWADVAPFPSIPGGPRAAMLAALAGLSILGFGMIALVWLGARFVQRYRHSGPLHPTPRPTQSDWDPQPLRSTPPEPPASKQ